MASWFVCFAMHFVAFLHRRRESKRAGGTLAFRRISKWKSKHVSFLIIIVKKFNISKKIQNAVFIIGLKVCDVCMSVCECRMHRCIDLNVRMHFLPFQLRSAQLSLVSMNLISGCCFLFIYSFFLDAELNLLTFHTAICYHCWMLVFCSLERNKKREFFLWIFWVCIWDWISIHQGILIYARLDLFERYKCTKVLHADLRLVCTPVAPEMEVWTRSFSPHSSLISFFSFIFAHFSFQIQAKKRHEKKCETKEQTECSVCAAFWYGYAYNRPHNISWRATILDGKNMQWVCIHSRHLIIIHFLFLFKFFCCRGCRLFQFVCSFRLPKCVFYHLFMFTTFVCTPIELHFRWTDLVGPSINFGHFTFLSFYLSFCLSMLTCLPARQLDGFASNFNSKSIGAFDTRTHTHTRNMCVVRAYWMYAQKRASNQLTVLLFVVVIVAVHFTCVSVCNVMRPFLEPVLIENCNVYFFWLSLCLQLWIYTHSLLLLLFYYVYSLSLCLRHAQLDVAGLSFLCFIFG